jgi:hypothetical protein
MELLDVADTRKPKRWSRMHSCISVGRSLRLMSTLVPGEGNVGSPVGFEISGCRKRLVGQLMQRSSVLRGSG